MEAPVEPPVSEITDDATPRRRWAFPVAITAGALAVYAIVFVVLLDRTGRDDDPAPPIASPTTTIDAAARASQRTRREVGAR